MKSNLLKIVKFIQLTHEFQSVTRRIFVVGDSRRENDMEHSFQLALLAWYIADSEKLALDKNRLVQYALIHDLVEVYAGDTVPYGDKALLATKKEREYNAAQRLQKEVPEFKDLHRLIEKYEARTDKESKFVYALDKIIPIFNIYLDSGHTWQADGVTLDMLIAYKTDKVAFDERIKKYFDELVRILKKEEVNLFPGKVGHRK